MSSSQGADTLGSRKKYLCLTICGYRRPGMSEAAYRDHMVNVSAPLTKDLMVKYGVKRWTQIHNQPEARALMSQLFDAQMVNLADYDCFSQVFFEDIEQYKRMKQDPWYKQHLVGDHVKFADTQKSKMTIGWVEEYIREGSVVDGFSDGSEKQTQSGSEQPLAKFDLAGANSLSAVVLITVATCAYFAGRWQTTAGK